MANFITYSNDMLKNFSLNVLGDRIIIFGPMASGKSTTADLLGKKLNYPVYHLDQMYFLPGTSWSRVPVEAFQRRHADLVKTEKWIIDGNYKETFRDRIALGTSILWFNPSIVTCIFRFYKRYFRRKRNTTCYPRRVPHIKERFTIENLKYIFRFKNNIPYFLNEIEKFPSKKFFYFPSFKSVKMFQDYICKN